MTDWNIAALFDAAAARFPDRAALTHADEGTFTYGELAEASARMAGYLDSIGIGKGDHVAIYAPNCVGWIVCALAAYQVRAAPVNINYRYTERELSVVFSDSDPKAVVFARTFGSRLAGVDLPSVVRGGLVVLEDGTDGAAPAEATSYNRCLEAPAFTPAPSALTGDERYVMYTGGTTGSPKGVMWRHEDVLKAHGIHQDLLTGNELDRADAIIEVAADRPPITVMALGQLMHANGLWVTLRTLLWGNHLVLQRRFDPVEVWQLVADHGINSVAFVGDAMARPLAEELQRNPGQWDLSSLQALSSAAAVFSASVRDQLFELLPNIMIAEAIGTSETGVEGNAPAPRQPIQNHGGPSVNIGPAIGLVDDDDKLIPLRPGARGRIARTGHIAQGYLKDPVKTQATFMEIDGRRWAVPGDYAEVVDEHTIVLRGRGSASINTGGEKVFAEEVEAAIKAHPSVADVLVVAVPDQRWGQAVGAVVEFRPGQTASLEDVRERCRATLADYKLPRVLVPAPRVTRSPSGKPDYRWAKSWALEHIGSETTKSERI